ncbi:unnamed protein product [Soboliphyme baturini]|uniref:Talin central domain-containing protein n=1 Tax=Soboliphyme baturini TaxID=241478 RepID=A0A183IK49_9BILA|nr:unnamed protein product [Soboliphyme baturini]
MDCSVENIPMPEGPTPPTQLDSDAGLKNLDDQLPEAWRKAQRALERIQPHIDTVAAGSDTVSQNIYANSAQSLFQAYSWM